MKHQKTCSKCLPSFAKQVAARRAQGSRVRFRMPVLTNFLNGVLNSQTEKLPGDLQDAEYLFVAGFQSREEFLLLQLKCGYSFRNARNREDAAQRLQRFVHCEVFFKETFHRPASSECPRASL
jgi:hypothetical protein